MTTGAYGIDYRRHATLYHHLDRDVRIALYRFHHVLATRHIYTLTPDESAYLWVEENICPYEKAFWQWYGLWPYDQWF